jgi:hypothetical protein
MNMKSTTTQAMTFAMAVVVGSAAAIAFASAASVSQVAPALRTNVSTPVDVIRLEPVVVTISKTAFDTARHEETQAQVARSNEAKKVTRG